MLSLPRPLTKLVIFASLLFANLLTPLTALAQTANNGVAPVLVPYIITSIAGNSQSAVAGYGGDGVPAGSATLNAPGALAVDSVGNLYIADVSNALIREVNAQTGIIRNIAGVPPSNCVGTVCTTVTSGCVDGVPAAGNPTGSRINGMVVDGFGNLYFSDYNYQGAWVIYHGGARVASFISLVDASGVTTAGGVKPGYVYHIAGNATPKAGGGCTSVSGTVDNVLATQAIFHDPLQMGIDAAGNIYMQDYANSVVRVVNTQTTIQTFFGVSVKPGFVAAIVGCNKSLTVACPSTVPPFGGPAGSALFSNVLTGMTTDQFGNVYEIDGKGATGSIYAGVAYAGGSALANLIYLESGLTAASGSWYEVINSITSTNAPVSSPAAVLANGSNDLVIRPVSIAVDPLGNVYMMDSHWLSVYRTDVNSQMSTRINGTSSIVGTKTAPVYCIGTSGPQSTDTFGDGCPATQAKFSSTGAGYITFDGADNLYVSDTGNNEVRKISVGTSFAAATVGATTTQYLQLHFDASNLPANAGSSFQITSGSSDFSLSGTPTCSNNSLGIDKSIECYVTIAFKPSAAGSRAATLQATTANGSLYALALTGFANGAQIAIDGGTPSTVSATGLGKAAAVTVDTIGNTYIADSTNNRVVVLPAGGGAQTAVGTGLSNPQGVAVDAVGNVYIADTGNARIVKIAAISKTQTVLTTDVKNPQGLAVDTQGNLYVADTGNARIVQISPFGELGTATLLSYTGAQALVSPVALATDKLGNLYVADSGNSNGLIKILAGGGDLQPLAGSTSLAAPATIVPFGAASVSSPTGVAVDGAGNLYVTDGTGNTVTELPAASGPGSEPFRLNFPGIKSPGGLALDIAGNLYLADSGNNRVLEDNRSNLTINFGDVYIHQAPGTAPLTITNIGTTPLTPASPFAAVSGTNAADFSETDTCGASNFPLGTIASGLHCGLTPAFTPSVTGNRTASLSVQNGAATVSLNGVGFLPQAVLSLAASAPGGLVANQTATVTVTASQPDASNIPSGGQITFSYSINGVTTTLPAVTLPAS